MPDKVMTASKAFLFFCLSFVGGIFLNSIFKISQLLMLGFLILALILISVLWKYKKIAIFGCCVLFLVVGMSRHQQFESNVAGNNLGRFNGSSKNMTIIGVIDKEPDIKEKSIKFRVEAEEILTGDELLSVRGKILVSTWRYPEFKYGDKLRIVGKLEAPPVLEDFNYKDYLKKDGVYSVINFPEIEVVGHNFGNPVISTLLSFKNKFKEVCRSFVSVPQEGLLEALVFGDEENISQEWKDRFNFTGTRHITAVSGMNITIIASLIMSFALSFGLWRRQVFYLSIFLLLLYILMIGAPASGVRAGIMAGIFMLAQYFGRSSSSLRAVVFAASIMLFFNPFLLTLDIGFQLSFLAILGIIYLQPAIDNLFRAIPNPRFFPLRSTLSTTLSAQVFTLPILIYNFGYIPLVS
ncbi:MAG: ComEC/Rec2 family competence protein, partial [Candidatus Paceibacterota bacterium]